MEFTFKDRLYQMKWRAQAKAKRACKNTQKGIKNLITWSAEHPMEASAIATGITTVVAGTTKVIKKAAKTRAEEERMRRYYDPKTYNWVTCRRELTGKEKIEFSRRRENGESVTRILESMGLVK